MKLHDYNWLIALQTSRRALLKGAAGVGALAAFDGIGLGALTQPAFADAEGDLRAKLLQIPGVGKGSPTDADWQKVGALCLDATKANVKKGEFKGVELSFMGLNNQNLHNLLFRGFLKPWEAYTGAKITWIDLAQADYNPRLQQTIARGVPKTWQQVQAVTKFLKGKKIGGQDAYGYLDAPKPWGGFGFYFLGSRATAYAKHPDDKAWLFDVDTMKPRINNPAWVRAIQDVIDALPSEPADQLNADPNTTGFQQFLGGTGSMCVWWGDIGSNAKTNDASVVGDKCGFDILPGSDDVYNAKSGKWEKLASGTNFAPNLAYLGWGIYVMARVDKDELKHKAAWSAAAHLGGKNLALWTAAYPSGFQCYRNSQHNIDEWVAAGYDKDFITNYLDSQFNSYNHPNGAIEPRIPGIFQYYSIAEDELAKIFAGKETAQAGADNIAAAWEKLTDQIGRDSQIKLYKGSLGV